jgi:hypothetical protein
VSVPGVRSGRPLGFDTFVVRAFDAFPVASATRTCCVMLELLPKCRHDVTEMVPDVVPVMLTAGDGIAPVIVTVPPTFAVPVNSRTPPRRFPSASA